MKRTLVLGMVMTALSFNVAVAAGPALRAVDTNNYKTAIPEYRDKVVKPFLFDDKNLQGKTVNESAKSKLLDNLKLNADRSGLQKYLESGNDSAKLENLIDVTAQLKVGKQLEAREDAESKALGKSLNDSAKAQLSAMAAADLNGAPALKGSLSKDEQVVADQASDKYTSMSEILFNMSAPKRDLWTQTFQMRDTLLNTKGGYNGAEALLEAIMSVHKVSKAEAIEIMKRMSGCKE